MPTNPALCPSQGPRTLSDETLDALWPHDPHTRAKANYALWCQQRTPTEDVTPAVPQPPPPPPPTLPDVGELAILRDWTRFLALWSLSRRTGYAFCKDAYLAGGIEYPNGHRPGVKTIQASKTRMEASGWIRRVRMGRRWVTQCLVTPQRLASLIHSAYPLLRRYLSRFLSAIFRTKTLSPPLRVYCRDKTIQRPAPNKNALPAEAEQVVMLVQKEGMGANAARSVATRPGGVGVLTDALDAFRAAVKAGREITNRGGYLHALARRAFEGKLTLPPAVHEARDRAEREAEKRRQRENRTFRAPRPESLPPPRYESEKSAAPENVPVRPQDAACVALLEALPPNHLACIEAPAREEVRRAGAGRLWADKDWRDLTRGKAVRDAMIRLLENGAAPE